MLIVLEPEYFLMQNVHLKILLFFIVLSDLFLAIVPCLRIDCCIPQDLALSLIISLLCLRSITLSGGQDL